MWTKFLEFGTLYVLADKRMVVSGFFGTKL